MADAGPEEDARTEADEAPPAPRAKFDPGAALEKLADTRRDENSAQPPSETPVPSASAETPGGSRAEEPTEGSGRSSLQVVALAAVEQRANAQRKALLTLMTSALQDAGAIEDKPIKRLLAEEAKAHAALSAACLAFCEVELKLKAMTASRAGQVPKGAAAQQNEFERLTWELQQLKEKPKEAERKLARLERALAHDIHVLAHVREKLGCLQIEKGRLQQTLQGLEASSRQAQAELLEAKKAWQRCEAAKEVADMDGTLLTDRVLLAEHKRLLARRAELAGIDSSK